MSGNVNVRIEKPHNSACRMRGGGLVYVGDYRRRGVDGIVHRDAIGRKHKHAWQLWLSFICNDIECDAAVLAKMDFLADAVQRELDETEARP